MFLVMMMFAGVFWGFIEVTINNSNTMTFRRFWRICIRLSFSGSWMTLGPKSWTWGGRWDCCIYFWCNCFWYRRCCCFPLLLFNRHLTGDGWNVDLAALPHLLRPDHGHDRPHQRHRHRHARLLCKTSWLQLPWGFSSAHYLSATIWLFTKHLISPSSKQVNTIRTRSMSTLTKHWRGSQWLWWWPRP